MPERLRLTVLSGEARGRTVELAWGTYMCGTDPECDLVLGDGSVSRRNLQISGNLALAARRAALDRAHPYRLLCKHGLARG